MMPSNWSYWGEVPKQRLRFQIIFRNSAPRSGDQSMERNFDSCGSGTAARNQSMRRCSSIPCAAPRFVKSSKKLHPWRKGFLMAAHPCYQASHSSSRFHMDTIRHVHACRWGLVSHDCLCDVLGTSTISSDLDKHDLELSLMVLCGSLVTLVQLSNESNSGYTHPNTCGRHLLQHTGLFQDALSPQRLSPASFMVEWYLDEFAEAAGFGMADSTSWNAVVLRERNSQRTCLADKMR